ncbi:MAG: hypothetical protein KGS10_05725 [Chloroflexi bacterium]|nr:hypothetical protein [Chloroflexota bacterium]
MALPLATILPARQIDVPLECHGALRAALRLARSQGEALPCYARDTKIAFAVVFDDKAFAHAQVCTAAQVGILRKVIVAANASYGVVAQVSDLAGTEGTGPENTRKPDAAEHLLASVARSPRPQYRWFHRRAILALRQWQRLHEEWHDLKVLAAMTSDGPVGVLTSEHWRLY